MATATQNPPQVTPVKRDNKAARQLLRKWHTEETQDDEATWLDVKQLIEENRLSVRRKFGE